ncbi:acetyl-CoA carboxylase biotin carboxyl carrier protein [Croceibacterium ferulae]|uniref:acetyl-CoA carboxylase biotin carboxyl carrier protein n=1 Tax=Croceibacterium ferulae TaxID=1854641 RepID=UPI000EB2F4BD|nr:acetyl-CoA carboxylase biotin carboxyl carrier protein [Croceibacterium ferulae]
MKIDSTLVRELAEMLVDTGLTEIEVEEGARRIRVVRQNIVAAAPPAVAQAAASYAPPALPASAPSAPVAEAAPDMSNALRSPMVGTAYLSPEPGSAQFVKVGDTVKAGDTLLIVEAMKVMNPITATKEGVVREILITNAQPIEFDQPLMVIG